MNKQSDKEQKQANIHDLQNQKFAQLKSSKITDNIEKKIFIKKILHTIFWLLIALIGAFAFAVGLSMLIDNLAI
jgi:hypothetical protein